MKYILTFILILILYIISVLYKLVWLFKLPKSFNNFLKDLEEHSENIKHDYWGEF